MRLFTGIKPDIETASYLNKKAGDASRFFKDARFIRCENYHITLVFIGEADRKTYSIASKAVKESAEKTGNFEIGINGTGKFKRGKKSLYYFAIEKNTFLEKIQNQLFTRLSERNIITSENNFHAHITFARDVVTDVDINNRLPVEASFKANEILLMESIRENKKLVYPVRYNALLKEK